MDNVSIDSGSQVISLLNEAYATRVSNLRHSIALAERALSISREIADKALMGKSLNQLSLFHMIMGDYKVSISMAEEATGYFEELNDERGIADATYSIAGAYYKTDNYHLGLIYLINCLTIYRKFDDYHNQARVQKSLGTIYEYFGDLKNAIKSYESAIEAARKAGDSDLESNAYNPLSGIYLKQGRIEKARDVIEKSIAMKKQTNDIRGLAFAIYGKAKVFTKQGLYTEAEQAFKRSIEIHVEMGERLGLAMAYYRMGAMYFEMGDLKQSKAMLRQAIGFARTYNIIIIQFKGNYLLYKIYKQLNDPVRSLSYLERYLTQKEAVINTQTLKIIENYELITKMESLEKEARLQKEKAEIIEKKERAEQAAQVKQDFLSTMSHEIRTPLNAVIMITRLLREKSEEDETELLNSLASASNSLLLVINDILDFTKLENGKVNIENRSCNFHGLLESIKRTYESLAVEKGLTLSLAIAPEVWGNYGMDETKVSQILGNLVSNAIKYTEHGKVDLLVDLQNSDGYEDQLCFKIVDTGIGIDAPYLEDIFESFYQPTSITTRKQGGSGLGLAIVKRLVELHGSRIFVESTIGVGSVFSFSLKLKRADMPSRPAVKRSEQLKDKTVLLAEDNMINAMVARRLLSNWGITTEHAKNGLEAVEKSKQKVFDFILMDIHMPEMNGFHATENIRKYENLNTRTPIFALTADITAEHQEEYISYFDGFLRKPIEIDKLFEALSGALVY
ncbi:tetratricopeptide repeat protein [Hufsiella ginkgonis]|uniref:histidine kinase n=1 Tax=Hufsiella ginkgonis TaxID=2695274 RepID=A0A7K1Y267_9SPHI|nr:tetratricopeptide repeat protein [Hufsiella ginkgonis]MXV17331.1 tetratricopeptide repeat protein [Hufsiella ginkgonis]